MDILKFAQSKRTTDAEEEDFKRVDSEALQAEGGDDEASGADSSFSLASARPVTPVPVVPKRKPKKAPPKAKQRNIDVGGQWPFVRTQFLRPKMLKLDAEEFLDEETGLEYLLGEMDKQAKEQPIMKPSN